MNKKIVLGFEIEEKKEKLIDICCRSCMAEYRRVEKKDYRQSLGSLAGIPGIPVKEELPEEKIQQEMIVFSGFDQEELQGFLGLYRSQGIEKIDYKATVTMYNIFWTPGMLYGELRQEHENMKRS